MTSKLEKQFFDTFGIDKRIEFEACHAIDSSYTYSTAVKRYPQITDHILLELIVIISSKIPFLGRAMYMEHRYRNIEDLKVTVLNMLIEYKVQYEHQVHTLFGVDND